MAERREREKAELRRAILDAARDLFVTEDYHAVSIRRIAEKIEYSPTSIYLYFKDKTDIVMHLTEEGFELLIQALRPAARIADPLERIRRFGEAYTCFAADNPHYYKLMFQLEGDEKLREACLALEAGDRALAFLVQTFVDGVQQGVFRADLDPVLGAHVLWAHAHGAVALALAGRLDKFQVDPRRIFEQSVETTVRGFMP